jgi:hypothetical protein
MHPYKFDKSAAVVYTYERSPAGRTPCKALDGITRFERVADREMMAKILPPAQIAWAVVFL